MRRKWENAENSEREKHTFCCVLPPVTQFRSELEAKRISLHESKFALLCKSDSVKGKKRKKTSSSSLQVLLLKQEMGFSLRSLLGTWGRQKREKALNSNKIYSDHKFTVDYRKRVAESEWNGIRRKKGAQIELQKLNCFLKAKSKGTKIPLRKLEVCCAFQRAGLHVLRVSLSDVQIYSDNEWTITARKFHLSFKLWQRGMKIVFPAFSNFSVFIWFLCSFFQFISNFRSIQLFFWCLYVFMMEAGGPTGGGEGKRFSFLSLFSFVFSSLNEVKFHKRCFFSSMIAPIRRSCQ